jgi:hypothetical protein
MRNIPRKVFPICFASLILFIGQGLVWSQTTQIHSSERDDTFMKWPDPSALQCPAYNAPDWLRDAVIVEVPIRGFNHPDYNHTDVWENEFGSASYLSVIEKLDFLKELGVNVICLYSIYNNTPGTNLYAIRHHESNPDLGTLDDIKTLVDQAHLKGIYVISNTNHYGVDQTSPMINEHPDWFLPKENHLYGQRVFDVNNPDVVQYIIDTHTWWCTEMDLDGWRIDIAHETYRKYIWDPVLRACYAKGKQILLATEGVHLEGHIRGAGWSDFPDSRDMEDPLFSWERPEAEYGSMKDFCNFTKADPYHVKDISSHNSKTPCAYNYNPDECPREGAYHVQGSRYLFGHNLLFAPFVPWMMVGELFNATHLAVPGLLNHGLNGKMLHSYIDWDDINEQQDVIADFTRIAQIRNNNKDIFHNNRYETNLLNIPFDSEPYSNVKPYARFIPGEKAIIVVGNKHINQDVTVRLEIPLGKLGLDGAEKFTFTDLWNNRTWTQNAEQLKDFMIEVPKDKSPGGGVRAILIVPK